MNSRTLGIAIDEAQRFITRAKRLYGNMKHDEKTNWQDHKVGPRATGEVRRASMDLTRALADMRRPG